MKKFSRHILSVGIMVVALLLTADAALGQKNVYEEIEYEAADAPLLTIPLRNIMSGELPFFAAYVREKLFGIKMTSEDDELMPDEQGIENGESDENATNGDAMEDSTSDVDTGDLEAEVSAGNPEGADAVTDGDAASVTDGNAAVTDGNAAVTDGNAAVTDGNAEMAVTDGNAADTADTAPQGDLENPSPEVAANPEHVSYVMTTVPDSYFDDALFIGDSRTVGLSEYCEQLKDRATFYSKVSLTIYAFSKKPFVTARVVPPEGYEGAVEDLPTEKVTIEEALSRRQFAKIYIMLGLNELGSGTAESFAAEYGSVVARIRELQPDAIIYIQGIMHVTHKKSESDRTFKNSTINARNEALSTLADNEHVFYVDMNSATDDENGALGQDLSFDNVHLKAKSYALWYDYLKNHAYVDERNLDQIKQELQQEIDQNNPEGASEETAQ